MSRARMRGRTNRPDRDGVVATRVERGPRDFRGGWQILAAFVLVASSYVAGLLTFGNVLDRALDNARQDRIETERRHDRRAARQGDKINELLEGQAILTTALNEAAFENAVLRQAIIDAGLTVPGTSSVPGSAPTPAPTPTTQPPPVTNPGGNAPPGQQGCTLDVLGVCL